jgi:hypothetical protein
VAPRAGLDAVLRRKKGHIMWPLVKESSSTNYLCNNFLERDYLEDRNGEGKTIKFYLRKLQLCRNVSSEALFDLSNQIHVTLQHETFESH